MRVKFGILAALFAMLVSGCATIRGPKSVDSVPNPAIDAPPVQEVVKEWPKEAVSVDQHAHAGIFILKPRPIPQRIREMQVEIQSRPDTTIREFTMLLQTAAPSVPFVVGGDLPDDRVVFVPAFKGKLGDLLDAVAYASDISFTWRARSILITERTEYIISIPQYPELAEAIKKDIEGLGVKDAQVLVSSNSVRYMATPRQQRAVRSYLRRTARNAAVVTLQVALLNVQVNGDTKRGIDWSAVQSAVNGDTGSAGAAGASGSLYGGALSGSNTTGNPLNGISISGGSIALGVAQSGFNLSAAIDLLSTYGDAKTTQNIVLRTLSGVPVSLRNGSSVPYVANVGVTASGITGGTAITSPYLFGSASTKTAESGLTLELTPYYDVTSDLVTVGVDLDMSTVTGFVELSAGNQLGKFTQPSTQDQKFKSLVRIRPGRSVVIGGLQYKSLSNSFTKFPSFGKKIRGGRSSKTNAYTFAIVLRPTVKVFGNFRFEERVRDEDYEN